MTKIKTENCPPIADSLLESSRSYGYDLSTAIADIIDNSISGHANNVWLLHDWNANDSIIGILDDGDGMDENTLRDAMRLGSSNPRTEREGGDLGRFGLGMKTASMSQCRRLTVASKQNNALSVRCWDMDFVGHTGEWSLQLESDDACKHFIDRLQNLESGTIIIWQKLDRVIPAEKEQEEDQNIEIDFFNKIDGVNQYLGMVFHRFMTVPRSLKIYINSINNQEQNYGLIKAWDPFLEKESHNPTPDPDKIPIGDTTIEVMPYIIPHKSQYSTTQEWMNAGGPFGWNAHQGYYLYREKRLIIYGSWFNLGYKKEDHYKLCRIRLDIDNSIDNLWKINVKKSSAEVPDSLKRNLKRIAERTRVVASEIYRKPGNLGKREHTKVNDFVWLKKRISGISRYVINKDHILIKKYLKEIGNSKPFRELINLIELMVPIDQIIMTNNENPDSHINFKNLNNTEYEQFIPLFKKIYKDFMKNGIDFDKAYNMALKNEPFCCYMAQFESLKDELDAS